MGRPDVESQGPKSSVASDAGRWSVKRTAMMARSIRRLETASPWWGRQSVNVLLFLYQPKTFYIDKNQTPLNLSV